MKTLFKPLTAILLIAVVWCAGFSPVMAEATADTAQILSERPTIAYGGARFFDGKTVASYGVGRQLGDHLWLFTINDYGVYTSTALELAYVFNVAGPVSFGILAGPNVDFVNVETEPDPIAYLLGAGGGLLSLEFKHSGGLWAYWKKKFKLGEQDGYLFGSQFGAGAYLRIGL